MSENSVHHWIDEEAPAPFWKPFSLALLLGIPASALTFFGALSAGMLIGLVGLLLGLLCGVGARLGHGDFFPAFMATLIHLVVTLALITASLLSKDLEVSLAQTLVALLRFENFSPFANACVEVAGRTILSYPLAFLAAYKVVGDGE